MHSNCVELIGHYGGDETHAASAWVSTDRTKVEREKERMPKLLKMLAENGHSSVFEKSLLHFLVICDTASHIHLLKHRIGVSVNSESARYKELQKDKFYIPADWPESMKAECEKYFLDGPYSRYHESLNVLREHGFDRRRAKESARFFLPYANQLILDVSFNWRSFHHFQNLRNKPEAQLEIRNIAQEMLRSVIKIPGNPFQYTLEAFGYA